MHSKRHYFLQFFVDYYIKLLGIVRKQFINSKYGSRYLTTHFMNYSFRACLLIYIIIQSIYLFNH